MPRGLLEEVASQVKDGPSQESEELREAITTMVAPVVMISACGLLLLATFNRYAVIIGRIRAFHTEEINACMKLAKLRNSTAENDQELVRILQHRIHGLESQLHSIFGRAKLIRNSIAGIVVCIALQLLTVVFIGLTIAFPRAGIPAITFFALGMVALLYGVSCILAEILRSTRSVEKEIRTLRHEGRSPVQAYVKQSMVAMGSAEDFQPLLAAV
ncbi:unnamed protein product [Pedinophyceae sp. YPF-701]|nr:unnamed protein product [Pedinophyceae sp. YPF-701]